LAQIEHFNDYVFTLGKSWNSDTNRYSIYMDKFSFSIKNQKLAEVLPGSHQIM